LPAERKIESLLSNERWHLIQSGIDRKSIKIRYNKIFVQKNLYSQVINSTLVLSQPHHSNTKTDSSNWLDHELPNHTPIDTINHAFHYSDTQLDVSIRNIHTKQLHLLLWNARSLNKQINAFQSYVYSDIIAITETWLSNHIFTNEILPSSYNDIRKDRDGRGGGVLLAFKKVLKITQLSSPDELEIISAEIVSSLFLCHPPNSTEQCNSSLINYLNSLDGTKDLVLLGYLNLPGSVETPQLPMTLQKWLMSLI